METNKKIEDFLHLYLGCMVKVPDEKEPDELVSVGKLSGWVSGGCDYAVEDIKPILRKLSTMTSVEMNECAATSEHIGEWETPDEMLLVVNAAETKYLLSKSFDLFGLIESGLAIDSQQPISSSKI